MRKSIALLSVFIMLGGTMGYSQSRFAEFENFRKKIHSDYNNFRTRILDQYADFLNGEWHEFEAILEEESPYTEPKPEQLPDCEGQPETLVTNMMLTRLPNEKAGELTLPGLNGGISTDLRHVQEEEFKTMKIDVPAGFGGPSGPKISIDGLGNKMLSPSEAEGKSNYELAALKIPDPNFAFGPFQGQTEAPRPDEAGIKTKRPSESSNSDEYHFDFYGMDAFIPAVEFSIADSITSTTETGQHWEMMASQPGGKETARQLFGLAQQLGLNGYLTFRLTESYVDQKFAKSNQKARMSAIHFLMSNMGYDIRLSNIADMFTVMMPFDQKIVYGLLPKTYDGRRYSMLLPEGKELPKASKGQAYKFTTCQLPSDALGKTSDLRLTGLNIPMRPKDFEISRNGLTIKGTVNDNIRGLLFRYPQMPAGDFASSWIDQQLRDDIVAQIKAQVQDMTETQAINTLLSLCHYGFDYATDQKQHGFEKPYFLEENFIYDCNDCEDRAIFFSYLVWNALGLPCQLIQYPGHESVTIATLADIDGCYYDAEGTKYYSSDPTYRGSRIGQVMPAFETAVPTVDKHYK